MAYDARASFDPLHMGDSPIRWGIALLPTIGVGALIVALDMRQMHVHWPTHLLVFCVAFATYLGGRLPGLISATASAATTGYMYALPGHWFTYLEADRLRVLFNLSLFALAVVLVDRMRIQGLVALREASLRVDLAAQRTETDKLKLLHAMTRLIYGASDVPSARAQILRLVCDWMGAVMGQIWYPSAGGALACAPGWYAGKPGFDPVRADSETITLSPGEGLPGRAWAQGAAVVADSSALEQRLARAPRASAGAAPWAIAVPIFRDGNLGFVAEFVFDREPPPDMGRAAVLAIAEDQMAELGLRRQAEILVQRKEREIRLLLDSTAEAIFGLDAHGLCTFANTAGLRLLGAQTAADLERADLHALVHPVESSEPHSGPCRMAYALREGSAAHASADEFRRFDGTCVPVEYWCHPIGDGEERTVVTAIDISDRKIIEEKLRQAQKMESLGRLAGGVAHDFNNLLTVIIGSVEFLDLDRGDPRHTYVESIGKAAEYAADLTRQLLAFSHRQLLELEQFNLNAIVSEASRMLERLVRENVVLRTSLSADDGFIRADRGQIQQVLINLVVNARDAILERGVIIIATANVTVGESDVPPPAGIPAGPYVRLTVSDNGRGIDRQLLERVFEPFFTTKASGKGTGLGLATVYGIVKQVGGHVRVYSEPGTGTVFSVYFPRIEAAPADPGVGVSESQVVRALGSETILLVEDDPLVRELTHRILLTHGYTVVAAENGTQALAAAENARISFDLLITDVIMPDMSGRELHAALAARGMNLKVVFMSGYTRDVMDDLDMLPAAVGLLQKPFSAKSFASKIRQVLDDAQDHIPARRHH